MKERRRDDGPQLPPPRPPRQYLRMPTHARAATPMFAPVGLWVESGVGPPVEASPQCREQAGGGRQGQRGRGHGRGQRRAKGARARWVWTKGLHARGYESVLKDTGNLKSPGPGQGAQPSNAHWGTGEAAATYMRLVDPADPQNVSPIYILPLQPSSTKKADARSVDQVLARRPFPLVFVLSESGSGTYVH